MSGLAKRLPSGMALTRATPHLRSCATPGRGARSSSPLPGLRWGTDRAAACDKTPPPNPTAAGPYGRRVLSRVGAVAHAVTPQAPWTGSGWRGYSYGGFGGGHHISTRISSAASPIFTSCTISLGICAVRAATRPDLQSGLSANDRERPLFTEVNGTATLVPPALISVPCSSHPPR